jgi:TatD DNase family protein
LNLNAFDSHAHLDLEQFDSDREDVISRALKAGVTRINTIGIDLEASLKSIALAERYPGIVASVGIHPQEAHKARAEDFSILEKLARHPRVVAVGEMGLDFHHGEAPREDQMKTLRLELDVAKKVNLPVIIHCREAQTEIRPVLREWARESASCSIAARGVIHCYSGDLETALFYISLGFYISVGAYLGYPSSISLRESFKKIPLNKLLVETDCPFLPPQKMRGKRNEPSYLPVTLGILAELKNLSLDEVASQTAANAIQLFNMEERKLI